MRRVIGVDPGPANTAIIARDGDELLHHACLHREDLSQVEFLHRVRKWVHRTIDDIRPSHLCIEAVVKPTGQLGKLNPQTLIGTAMIIGALVSWGRHWQKFRGVETQLIRPHGFGRGVLAGYPEELRTTKTGDCQHMRAAWDVSYQADGPLVLR